MYKIKYYIKKQKMINRKNEALLKNSSQNDNLIISIKKKKKTKNLNLYFIKNNFKRNLRKSIINNILDKDFMLCKDFNDFGICSYGNTCKFLHCSDR
ncbi:DNA binding protein (nucleomorph) [Bigelowiella natans]|uniref:DNA binding protein n=1 Tax=Bigelowiella natans TaxID=227086 RepID=Q3LW28_BIGNA|nr:DNA binding protein [Bigelowiella natans]ABA27337.1 DNA binding protein [Bigelowiella natans]|mmetsp:Transcript_42065/g.67688  ORF Transcript_42065/g.67688 Transcript_42065/m.67688 type:complete len:97 (+) Transcript_42065:2035-2325(+)